MTKDYFEEIKLKYIESMIIQDKLHEELEFEWELGLNALNEIVPSFTGWSTDTNCTLFCYPIRINVVDRDVINLWVKV